MSLTAVINDVDVNIPALGEVTDSPVASPNENASIMAHLRGLREQLQDLTSETNNAMLGAVSMDANKKENIGRVDDDPVTQESWQVDGTVIALLKGISSQQSAIIGLLQNIKTNTTPA